MKIKVTHDTGLILRLDMPTKSVDSWMTAVSKFWPSLVSAAPSIFQQAQEQAAAEAAMQAQEAKLETFLREQEKVADAVRTPHKKPAQKKGAKR